MKKSTNIILYLFYFCYYAGNGCYLPYINVYLEKHLHLTGSQIGAYTCFSLIASMLVIPLWGVIGDKTKKYKLLLLSFVAASLTFSYVYSKQTIYLGVLIFGTLLEVSRAGIIPMSDIQATNYCNKTNGNYGKFRAMGSLGWIIGGSFLGFVSGKIGLDRSLFTVYGLLLLTSLLLVFGFPKAEGIEAKKRPKGILKKLLKNTDFLFIVMFVLISGVLADSLTSYMGTHLVSTLHCGEQFISLNSSLTALPEIFLLGFMGGYLLPHYGFKKMYALSVAALIIRFTVYMLTSSPVLFVITSMLHCFSICCTTVVTLQYIHKTVSIEMFGTAVTILNAAILFGKAIYGYIYGLLYELFGSRSMFAFALVISVIAAVILFCTKKFERLDHSY
jgi:MFS family permease